MAAAHKTGLFQSIEPQLQGSLLIRDELYGNFDISEPVLVELLQCPAVQRLGEVGQHGVTGFLGLTSPVTRLEHSIGTLLLVRGAGASLEEQVVALLHDIAHTAFSHVIDWAFASNGDADESFHEVHKMRYVNSTELPAILSKHGFAGGKVFEEELFGLVERPAPHLCADRLDYSLRDMVRPGHLGPAYIRELLAHLVPYPDASAEDRLFVMNDVQAAETLAREYMAADRDMWSNPAHIEMYRRTGQLIGTIIRRGGVKEEQLWSLSDKELWEALHKEGTDDQREVMKNLEENGLPAEDNLPSGTKIRTIDPEVLVSSEVKPVPLSSLSKQWAKDQENYILARKNIQGKASETA